MARMSLPTRPVVRKISVTIMATPSPSFLTIYFLQMSSRIRLLRSRKTSIRSLLNS